MNLNFFEIDQSIYIDPKTYVLNFLKYQNLNIPDLIDQYQFDDQDLSIIKNHQFYPPQLIAKLNRLTHVSKQTWSNLNQHYQTGLNQLKIQNQTHLNQLISYLHQSKHQIKKLHSTIYRIELDHYNYIHDQMIIYMQIEPYDIILTDDGWQIDELNQHQILSPSLQNHLKQLYPNLNFKNDQLNLKIASNQNHVVNQFKNYLNLNIQLDQLIQNQKG